MFRFTHSNAQAIRRNNCYLYGVPLSIASNMRSEVLSMMHHLNQAKFDKQTKSCEIEQVTFLAK